MSVTNNNEKDKPLPAIEKISDTLIRIRRLPRHEEHGDITVNHDVHCTTLLIGKGLGADYTVKKCIGDIESVGEYTKRLKVEDLQGFDPGFYEIRADTEQIAVIAIDKDGNPIKGKAPFYMFE